MKARMKIQLAFVAAMALGLAACSEATLGPGRVTKVVSTTSFGMCIGYCSTRLEISEGEALLVRDSLGGRGVEDLPEQQFKAALDAAKWSEIARLAEAAKIDALPDVLGCPDCADGGAESLTIVSTRGEKTIKFDFGADIKEAGALLERVRALREELAPKE